MNRKVQLFAISIFMAITSGFGSLWVLYVFPSNWLDHIGALCLGALIMALTTFGFHLNSAILRVALLFALFIVHSYSLCYVIGWIWKRYDLPMDPILGGVFGLMAGIVLTSVFYVLLGRLIRGNVARESHSLVHRP